MRLGGTHAGLVLALAAHVVPRAHDHAGVDRDRLHWRMRKDKADGDLGKVEFGNYRLEVVAIGA